MAKRALFQLLCVVGLIACGGDDDEALIERSCNALCAKLGECNLLFGLPESTCAASCIQEANEDTSDGSCDPDEAQVNACISAVSAASCNDLLTNPPAACDDLCDDPGTDGGTDAGGGIDAGVGIDASFDASFDGNLSFDADIDADIPDCDDLAACCAVLAGSDATNCTATVSQGNLVACAASLVVFQFQEKCP